MGVSVESVSYTEIVSCLRGVEKCIEFCRRYDFFSREGFKDSTEEDNSDVLDYLIFYSEVCFVIYT